MTFDLIEPLEEEIRKKVRDKKERHRMQCERCLAAFDAWWTGLGYAAHATLVNRGTVAESRAGSE